MSNSILGLEQSERDCLLTLKHWLEDNVESIQKVLPMDQNPLDIVNALSKAMNQMSKHTLLSEGPAAFGSPVAESSLYDGYDGPCVVEDINGKEIAVLATRRDAERVASYAITPNGGYGSVEVKAASKDHVVTHQTFTCWIMNDRC